MKNLSVSKRYAKALILIGKEDDCSEQYNSELQAIVNLLDSQQDFEKALINPLYNKNDRRKVLTKVLSVINISMIMKSFLTLLFDKDRITFLRQIAFCYQGFADELKGVVQASIVSASKLSEQKIEQIKDALSKKVNKQIVLDVQQDPELIGGVVTKIGDLVIDGSVKTMLLNMSETLKKGEKV